MIERRRRHQKTDKDKASPMDEFKYHSPAYFLHHIPFLWITGMSETLDENDLEYFGMALYEDEESNRILAESDEYKQFTVAEAAHLNACGAKLALADPKDSIKIYRWIINHLEDWRHALEHDIHPFTSVPLEGLGEFNKLAAKLVPIGRCHGMVDEMVRKRYGNSHRIALRTSRKFEAKNARHQDTIFNDIVSAAAQLGYRYKWRGAISEGSERDADNYLNSGTIWSD